MPFVGDLLKFVPAEIKKSLCILLLAGGLVFVTWSGLFSRLDQVSTSSLKPDNYQRRLAVLVVPLSSASSTQQQQEESLVRLIESLKKCLVGTHENSTVRQSDVIHVSYFLFFNRESHRLAAFTKRWKNVFLVKLQKHLPFSGTENDPCQFINEAFAGYQLFTASSFDFALVVDTSISLTGPIDVARNFLGMRIALLLRSSNNNSPPKHVFSSKFLMPEDLLTNSSQMPAHHYSSHLFGGTVAFVQKMCKQVFAASSFHPNQTFHARLNAHFHQKPPTVLLIPANVTAPGISDSIVVLNCLNEHLTNPAPTQMEEEYGLHLENIQSEILAKAAERIEAAIELNYITEIRAQYKDSAASNSSLVNEFIVAECTKDFAGDCGGFGDRARGMLVTFYLAIATRRLFHAEQTKPVDLSLYFDLNNRLYDIPPDVYSTQLEVARKKSENVQMMGQLAGFDDFLSGQSLNDKLSQCTFLGLRANRYAGLHALLRNKKFASVIEQAVQYELGTADHGAYDYQLLISAGYRVIFRSMTKRLQGLFHDTINSTVSMEWWHTAAKIGIQIRTEKQSGFATDLYEIVKPQQIHCFTEKAREIVHKLRSAGKKVLVFITADWQTAVDQIKADLGDSPDLKILLTGEKQNLSLAHVDHTDVKADDPDGWLKMAKTYLDWILLTKMDYLVISRSGFGETAARLSLKPTWRLHHYEDTPECPFHDFTEVIPDIVATNHWTELYPAL